MMTHHEIVQAILDGKSLDGRDKQDQHAPWNNFCTDGTSGMPLLKVLETLIIKHHKNHEFRIRPTMVTKGYESRAYIVADTKVFHWISTNHGPQAEALNLYGGQARWIEETQYKTYEVPL
jgi:hypothetical protein